MLPAESHWIRTLKRSQSTNEELRVGSFASFAHPRLQPPDLTELHVPFCAYKNSSGCPKTLAIRQTRPEIGDGVVPFCACAKSGRSPEALDMIWRPRRDLNPCYRRESNTDGYLRRFQ